MRVSFAGGGTDLASFYRNGRGFGCVLSATINKYIYITVNKKFDDLIRVSYSKTEIVDSVDKVEHNIIREAMKIVGVEGGLEVVYMGDMPLGGAGVGLGSSSALAVGVLNALYAYKGQHVSAEKLAREACMIEIDILGHPIGKQDQYIAAFGGINYIQFNKDETVFVDPVIFSAAAKRGLESRLTLFYTGIVRMSSDILQEQNDSVDRKLDCHNSLVDLTHQLRELLQQNDITAMGDILHKGWEIKTQLASKITSPQIDAWYQAALDAGADGGKIVGAGGGGFLLLYREEEKRDAVSKALPDLKESVFTFELQGSKIIYVGA